MEQLNADRDWLASQGVELSQWGPDPDSGKVRVYLAHFSARQRKGSISQPPRYRAASRAGPPAPPLDALRTARPCAINVPLAVVAGGAGRSRAARRRSRSGSIGLVAAQIPKLIVRVRFSSPAPRVQAQLRTGLPSRRLDHPHTFFDLAGH
jgi:hypothetical protein